MPFIQSDIHINRPLSDMLLKFDPSRIGYMRKLVWPNKPVEKLSNQIRSIAREQLLRVRPLKVGEGGRVGRVQFATGPTQEYKCEIFAAEALLDNIEMGNADAELSYQINQQETATVALNLALEQWAIEGSLRDTSKFTQNVTLSGVQQWSNPGSGSNPFLDLLTACRTVASHAQQKANLILMDHLTWGEFIVHPAVTKMVAFWSNGSIITTEILEKMLSDWLEPGSIQIYRARYNAADEGKAEDFRSMMGPDVFVGFKDSPGMASWGYGYAFAWNGVAGDDEAIVLQFPSYEPALLGNVIRSVSAVDYKVTNPKSAYLIKSAVDPTKTEFNGELGA